MGDYGAPRIGMKHADVFGALYSMGPCCGPYVETRVEDRPVALK